MFAGELGPDYHRQMMQYEDWLTKQAQFLDMHIKLLEQQIQKQKRAKKTIQARQRQVRYGTYCMSGRQVYRAKMGGGGGISLQMGERLPQ